MKLLRRVIATTLVIFCFIANSYADTSNTPATTPQPTYLFLQSAKWGTLKKTANDQFQLTLHDVSPYVIYLTDRPNRQAGVIKLPNFLSEWKKSQSANNFAAVAPNVDLRGAKLYGFFEEKYINNIMVMTDPVYNPKTQTLTYITQPLPDSVIHMKKNTIKLKNITLFFDGIQGICLTC